MTTTEFDTLEQVYCAISKIGHGQQHLQAGACGLEMIWFPCSLQPRNWPKVKYPDLRALWFRAVVPRLSSPVISSPPPPPPLFTWQDWPAG